MVFLGRNFKEERMLAKQQTDDAQGISLFQTVGHSLVLKHEPTTRMLAGILPPTRANLLPTILVVPFSYAIGKGRKHSREESVERLVQANCTLILAQNIDGGMKKRLRKKLIAFRELPLETLQAIAAIRTRGGPIAIQIFSDHIRFSAQSNGEGTIPINTRGIDSYTFRRMSSFPRRTWLDLEREIDAAQEVFAEDPAPSGVNLRSDAPLAVSESPFSLASTA